MPGRFFAGRNSILQPYRYETHAHTSEGSRCSQMPAEALVRYYAARGYTGLCITDHFLNGNTTVPSCGSWESRIDQFCAGYERAAEAGAKLGLSVFFGWEFSHAGTDFLTYGLDKAWLLRHPDCHTLRVPEYSALVHESGGFLVQAHPFREDWYIETIRLSPRDVDAVEVVNACRTAFENENADWYASRYALLKTAGSDIHRPLTQRAGLCTEKKLRSSGMLMEALQAGTAAIFTETDAV